MSSSFHRCGKLTKPLPKGRNNFHWFPASSQKCSKGMGCSTGMRLHVHGINYNRQTLEETSGYVSPFFSGLILRCMLWICLTRCFRLFCMPLFSFSHSTPDVQHTPKDRGSFVWLPTQRIPGNSANVTFLGLLSHPFNGCFTWPKPTNLGINRSQRLNHLVHWHCLIRSILK